MVESAHIHQDVKFPIVFSLGKKGLYGNVVMMPYPYINASSTSRSSSRLVGVRRLCAYTGSSCLGVSLILNLVFLPTSSRCRAKMVWYLTRRLSICWRSCPSNMELSQWKLAENACHCWASTVGQNSLLPGV